jgi:hypothetical protein
MRCVTISGPSLPWRFEIPPSEWDNGVPQGWLPIGISAQPPVIRWMRVGSLPLTSPFFQFSVNGMRSRKVPPFEFESDLPDLALAARLPSVPPAGIIFHMSRCGSTLVANALKTAENVVGLSEADPVDRMMHLLNSKSRYYATMSAANLPALISVFSRFQGGPEKKVVIKCTHEGINTLRAVRLIWPQVPCVILIRNPIEVVVSNCEKPPLWMNGLIFARRESCFGRPPHDVSSAGTVEFCTWVLGRLCSEALSSLDDRCRVIDYADLSPRVVAAIASYFSLRLTSDGQRNFLESFKYDAKNTGRLFESDVDAKRRGASESMLRNIDRWMSTSYEELRTLAAKHTKMLDAEVGPEYQCL